jgi:hypothetical protein
MPTTAELVEHASRGICVAWLQILGFRVSDPAQFIAIPQVFLDEAELVAIATIISSMSMSATAANGIGVAMASAVLVAGRAHTSIWVIGNFISA